jgi:hypothetical protein
MTNKFISIMEKIGKDALVGLTGGLAAITAMAQGAPPLPAGAPAAKTYELSSDPKDAKAKEQRERLKIALMVFVDRKKDADAANAALQKAQADANETIKAIEKENGWPDTLVPVQDPNDPFALLFNEPPAPPKPAPVPLPDKPEPASPSAAK